MNSYNSHRLHKLTNTCTERSLFRLLGSYNFIRAKTPIGYIAVRTYSPINRRHFVQKMAEEDEETFVFLEFAGLPDDKLLKSYTGKCSLLVRLLSFCSFKYMHLFCFIIMFTPSLFAESRKLHRSNFSIGQIHLSRITRGYVSKYGNDWVVRRWLTAHSYKIKLCYATYARA